MNKFYNVAWTENFPLSEQHYSEFFFFFTGLNFLNIFMKYYLQEKKQITIL